MVGHLELPGVVAKYVPFGSSPGLAESFAAPSGAVPLPWVEAAGIRRDQDGHCYRRQKAGEGHPHQAGDVAAGAVEATPRNDDDPEIQVAELDDQHVAWVADARDEMKVGSDRAEIVCRSQEGDHKEEQTREDHGGREAREARQHEHTRAVAAEVWYLRTESWAGHTVVSAATALVHADLARGRIGVEAHPVSTCLVGRNQAGAWRVTGLDR